MASNTTSISLSDHAAHDSADSIKQHIGNLIRRYVENRSATIALSIVQHIEALCAHPGFNDTGRDRCAYLRLRAHWRWLAASGE
jgi:hypothetical protein